MHPFREWGKLRPIEQKGDCSIAALEAKENSDPCEPDFQKALSHSFMYSANITSNYQNLGPVKGEMETNKVPSQPSRVLKSTCWSMDAIKQRSPTFAVPGTSAPVRI